MGRPRGRKEYSDEERSLALLALQTNDWQVRPAARETGIPASTLRDWKKEWQTEGTTAEIDVIVDAQATAFVEKATKIRDKALDRIEAILNDDESNPKLTELNAIAGTLDDKIVRARALRRNDAGFEKPEQIDARAAGQLLAGFVQEALQMGRERQQAVTQAAKNKSDKPALPAQT